MGTPMLTNCLCTRTASSGVTRKSNGEGDADAADMTGYTRATTSRMYLYAVIECNATPDVV